MIRFEVKPQVRDILRAMSQRPPLPEVTLQISEKTSPIVEPKPKVLISSSINWQGQVLWLLHCYRYESKSGEVPRNISERSVKRQYIMCQASLKWRGAKLFHILFYYYCNRYLLMILLHFPQSCCTLNWLQLFELNALIVDNIFCTKK